jgi:hypothetical protein
MGLSRARGPKVLMLMQAGRASCAGLFYSDRRLQGVSSRKRARIKSGEQRGESCGLHLLALMLFVRTSFSEGTGFCRTCVRVRLRWTIVRRTRHFWKTGNERVV